jgi:hypothetical protein
MSFTATTATKIRRANLNLVRKDLRIAELEELLHVKLEEKERRIAELEELLHLNEPLPIRYATETPFSKQTTHIVNALLARDMITHRSLRTIIGASSVESGYFYLCRARQWLRKTFSIEIQNLREVGWFLTGEDRRKLRFLLEREAHTPS